MFSIAYAFKGKVHMFEGRVKIVSHSSCRTSALLKYFCPLSHKQNYVHEVPVNRLVKLAWLGELTIPT